MSLAPVSDGCIESVNLSDVDRVFPAFLRPEKVGWASCRPSHILI